MREFKYINIWQPNTEPISLRIDDLPERVELEYSRLLLKMLTAWKEAVFTEVITYGEVWFSEERIF